jgi:hypothetical protein
MSTRYVDRVYNAAHRDVITAILYGGKKKLNKIAKNLGGLR